MEDENEFTESEIVPDKSVWRFAIAMGVLVLLLALLNIFLEDIRHLINPPPGVGQKTAPTNPKSLENTSMLDDEEVKAAITKFIEAFYVDQKKGYFDPPSYFTTITDTYYNYHHLTHQQLKQLNRERKAAYQKQTITWLVNTLNVVRRSDTLVATYWTKQSYIRGEELVQVKADILLELKLTREGKICSLRELEVLNLSSSPIAGTTAETIQPDNQEATGIPIDTVQKTTQEPSIFAPGALDTPPQFRGGQKKLLNFLTTNIHYPAGASEQGVEGKVFVYFVVEANGLLSNFKVLRGIGAGCDEEALRVVRLLPPWQAGTLNGVEVRSSYILPITFMLGN
jgi:TonB family protein